jgi:excisionase family DNA binding protein
VKHADKTTLEGWITTADVCRRMGCSASWVGELVRDGRLPHIQTPYGRLYRPDDVDVLAAELDAKRTEYRRKQLKAQRERNERRARKVAA